ncbi:MAG: CcdB family protein [Burkholderiaceae bacterium]
MRRTGAPGPRHCGARRLNPLLVVSGAEVSMVTQFMAAVPASELTAPVATLNGETDAIPAAIGFLHQGW